MAKNRLIWQDKYVRIMLSVHRTTSKAGKAKCMVFAQFIALV